MLFDRYRSWTSRVICRIAGAVPGLRADVAEEIVEKVAVRLREFAGNRPVMIRALGWAAAYRVLDAMSLWMFLVAFGHTPRVEALAIAYGLAYVFAVIPISPGGLGVVEAVATTVLVAFGAPRGEALLGVMAYRLINFWIPIPGGGLAYLSLRLAPPNDERPWTERLAEMTQDAWSHAEGLRDWAVRNRFISRSR